MNDRDRKTTYTDNNRELENNIHYYYSSKNKNNEKVETIVACDVCDWHFRPYAIGHIGYLMVLKLFIEMKIHPKIEPVIKSLNQPFLLQFGW